MSLPRPQFGGRASFKAAYPNVETIHVTVLHHGEIAYEGQETQLFTESNLPQVIPCVNPRCRQGGFRIVPIILALASRRKTVLRVTLVCNGHEGSPKRRRRGTPCFNCARIDFEVTFTSQA